MLASLSCKRLVVGKSWSKVRRFAKGMEEAIMGDVQEMRAKMLELEEENRRLKERLQFETTGRTNAERKLREKFVAETAGMGSIKPIGTIETCFPTRFGTPRQGSLVTMSKAKMTINNSVVGFRSLEGLEDFSHVWLLFVFHENTNMHKLLTSEEKPKHQKIFPSFVKPPQGGGIRVGLFATRTPHRPNPIGLSLVELEKVDVGAGTVFFRGIDLIDGTPILDIKPYVPHVDRVDDPKLASWVVNAKFDLAQVQFTSGAKADLESIAKGGKSKWFNPDEVDDLVKAVEQVVSLDPRGVIHGRGVYNSELDQAQSTVESVDLKEHLFRDNFVLDFDTFRIRFSPHPTDRTLVVHTVEQREN